MSNLSGILWIDCAASTNDDAAMRFHECDNMSVVAARRQSAGRGQGDHTWHSADGLNLTFSVVIKPACPPPASEMVCITHVCTLALLDYLAGHGIAARIKWPNDIWVGDRKICGLLINNRLQDGLLTGSIAGIGLNVNETDFPADLPDPTSMRLLTGRTYILEDELVQLRSALCRRAAMIENSAGRKALLAEFETKVFRLDFQNL